MKKHYQMKLGYCLSFQLVQVNEVGPELLLKTFPIIRDMTANPIMKKCTAIILQVNTI